MRKLTLATRPQAEAASGCGCAPSPGEQSWLPAAPQRVWLYLAALVLLYSSIAIYAVAGGVSPGQILLGRGFEFEVAPATLATAVIAIWLASGEMLTELMPYWIVGMLLAGMLVALAAWQKLALRLRSGGVGASAVAAGAGAAVPVCSCAMAPLLGGMTRAGVPLGPAMAFVIAAPMINIPAVMLTGGALGVELAAGRIVGTLALAMLAAGLFGWWAARCGGSASLLRLAPAEMASWCCTPSAAADGADPAKPWPMRIISSSTRLFLQMNGYLLLAVLLGGTIRALVPEAWITAAVGADGPLSIALAAAAASVLYFCTFTEVPTAAALMDLGMGRGAALAYLLVGPGISLPSLALLSAIFRPKLLIAYAGFAYIFAVSAGLVFNLIVP